MKSYFLFTLFIIILLSCSKTKEVKKLLITVEPSDNKSLFYQRDARYLKIYDENKDLIDEVRLQDNVDSKAKSFLFKPSINYILIDCNGVWYSIDYKTGIISKDPNYDPWIKKDLPSNYIGTYIRYETKRIYFLEKEMQVNKKDVYIYGGDR